MALKIADNGINELILPKKDIQYEIVDKIFVIKFVSPKNFNALSFYHYEYLTSLLDKANSNKDTLITLIVSTGKFFSSGANFKANNQAIAANKDMMHDFWNSKFLALNLRLSNSIYNHEKILVCGLNGPAIGLSAALVLLSDLVYTMNDDFYLLFPFTNLSLVTEGLTSVSVAEKIGFNRANEHLFFSKPIDSALLNQCGVINKNYNFPAHNSPNNDDSIQKFHSLLIKDLTNNIQGLDPESILKIKFLMSKNKKRNLKLQNLEEVLVGLDFFQRGKPQKKFDQLFSKQLKHKL